MPAPQATRTAPEQPAHASATPGPYGVTYLSYRSPHARQTQHFASPRDAAAVFARLHVEGKVGKLALVGPEQVLEAYATTIGNVLVLVREPDGYFRTELWCARKDGFHSETISLHEKKKYATDQIMPTFAGLCAAERAAKAAVAS